MKSISPFLWRRRVGMRDVDAWGVVWYGNYLVYCDEARAQLLRSYDLAPGAFQDKGFITPVVSVTSRYHAPARFDEEVDVAVRVQERKGSRIVFAFEITRSEDETLLSRHETTLVMLRTNGDLVYIMPEELSAVLSKIEQDQPAPA